MEAATLITQLLHAVEASQLLLAVPLSVLVAVYGVRRVLARAIPWVATDQGGAALSLVAAAAQAVAAAAALPGPHTVVGVLLVAVPLFFHNEVVFRAAKKLGVDLSVDPPAQFEPSPKPSSGPGGAILLPLLLAVIALPGCSGVSLRPDLGSRVIDCAGASLVSLAPDAAAALPKIAEAIQGSTVDWQPQLDAVMAKGGAAALCALLALLHSIEVGGTGGGEGAQLMVLRPAEQGGYPPATLLLRGYAYLEAHRE